MDDEADILESVRELLVRLAPSEARLRVLTAGSAPEALELLDREPVDVVVTDFRMPRMDGLAFLLEVRRQHGEIPCILTTAYPDSEIERRAVDEVHVAGLIHKPFDARAFVGAVCRLLGRSDAPARATSGP